jgi:ferritin-like metal-binding protein YciE
MKLETLKDLYVEQLRDLYNAEKQLIDALPKMADKASHAELREAIEEHMEETRQQKERLDRIFESLGERASGERCKAMEGLIKEGEELLNKRADSDVRDAGIIASAQRVEHYEISGYGTVRTYAEMLGRNEDARLLQQTLDEEKMADEKLNRIAMQVVNPEAVHGDR